MTATLSNTDLNEISSRRRTALHFLRTVTDVYGGSGASGPLASTQRFIEQDTLVLLSEIGRLDEVITELRRENEEAQEKITRLGSFNEAMHLRVTDAETHAYEVEQQQPDRDAFEEEKTRLFLDELGIPRQGREGNILTLSERVEVLAQDVKD